ncbi:hypothetical protein N5C36_18835 [Shewanella xiamenensis]|uniref:hypothetical protein n=1 Tax=Shewanella xiamenensis TaxID=332186 RepID=UPI00244B1B85|nr:hypothetical protein [Shewanella xiamenensis]MDH1316133.1 hypothetical protein [Shewanella xiamenensis]
MCGLCLEQGFVFRFVTDGFEAIEEVMPELPHYWFEFNADWDAIIERFKQQPDSMLDQRILWARLFIASFEKPLSQKQQALWHHLSEELAGALPEYPTLSLQLDEASQFPLGIAAYIGQQGLNHTALLAEATALLERHLLRAHFCVTMLNCLGVNSGWELGDKEYGKNRDIFLDSCWHEFPHRLFVCALLLTWAPESSTLKRFVIASPHYVVDFIAFEYRMQRWLLRLTYLEKGTDFLAENAEALLPEHLLYLLDYYSSSEVDIGAVRDAYFVALGNKRAFFPPHYDEQAVWEAFEMLSQRALGR